MNTSESVLAKLEEAGGKLVADDDIVRTADNTFAIPQSMSLEDASTFLYSKHEEETKRTAFVRVFSYRPWDGALATHTVLKRVFGMVRMDSVNMIQIPSDVDKTTEVPWGTFNIPLLPNVRFESDSAYEEGKGMVYRLSAVGPRSDRFAVAGVFELVEAELRANSLYRGKAFDGQSMPTFVDVHAVDRSKIVYSTGTEEQLSANVWSLLRFTEEHRQMGLPLKRAVLLEGPYGTGKTVGATITAQEAVANGWTFIYCRPGRDDLTECMATAKLYQPAVIFVEDVDVISDPETSGADGVSRLLDLFDGMSTKSTEVMVVMTTNHAERIHKGMVRPGRLDAVIHVGELDSDGIARMVRVLIPEANLDPDVNWAPVSEAMAGFLPAYIKEATDRARRYNLTRNNGVPTVIGTDDLVAAAVGLHAQLALMTAAKEGPTPDPLSLSLGRVVADAVTVPTVDMPDVDAMAWAFRSAMDGVSVEAAGLYMSDDTDSDGDHSISGEMRLRT